MRHRPLLLPRRPRNDSLNTSLAIVNIVFLLLLYFLVAGSHSSGPEFSIRLARVEDQANENVQNAVLIIEENGDLNLNGTIVAEAELAEHLRALDRLDIIADRDGSAQDLLVLLETPAFKALDLRLVTENILSSK